MYILEVDCGIPLDIPGAQNGNVTNTTYGSSFEFSCDSSRGFKMTGVSDLNNITVVCQSYGRWGYGSLTCEGNTFGSTFFFFFNQCFKVVIKT